MSQQLEYSNTVQESLHPRVDVLRLMRGGDHPDLGQEVGLQLQPELPVDGPEILPLGQIRQVVLTGLYPVTAIRRYEISNDRHEASAIYGAPVAWLEMADQKDGEPVGHQRYLLVDKTSLPEVEGSDGQPVNNHMNARRLITRINPNKTKSYGDLGIVEIIGDNIVGVKSLESREGGEYSATYLVTPLGGDDEYRRNGEKPSIGFTVDYDPSSRTATIQRILPVKCDREILFTSINSEVPGRRAVDAGVVDNWNETVLEKYEDQYRQRQIAAKRNKRNGRKAVQLGRKLLSAVSSDSTT